MMARKRTGCGVLVKPGGILRLIRAIWASRCTSEAKSLIHKGNKFNIMAVMRLSPSTLRFFHGDRPPHPQSHPVFAAAEDPLPSPNFWSGSIWGVYILAGMAVLGWGVGQD